MFSRVFLSHSIKMRQHIFFIGRNRVRNCRFLATRRQQRVAAQKRREQEEAAAKEGSSEALDDFDVLSSTTKKPPLYPATSSTSQNNLILPTSRVIQTNLSSHLEWLETQHPTFDPSKPPEFQADESGVVKRDLTESMIDLKELYDPRLHGTKLAEKGYELPTPLCHELIAYISVRGTPITVAEFMRQALTHPQYGYYTNPNIVNKDEDDIFADDEDMSVDNDWDREHNATNETIVGEGETGNTVQSTAADSIIGRRGDFVTAPEVSQVFGECLCVWFMTQYEDMGNPSDFQIIEVGPGKGTLLVDVLRTAFQRPEFGSACRRIHLVERSPKMRAEQERQLEKFAIDLNGSVRFEYETAPDSVFLRDKEVPTSKVDDMLQEDPKLEAKDDREQQVIRVTWHESFSSVVRATTKDESSLLPSFVICQEFIDALPVHVFEKTEKGWRERLVDVATRREKDEEEEAKQDKDVDDDDGLKPRLTFVLSPDSTPALRTLLKVDESGNMQHDDKAQVGDVCEVCPEGILLVQDVAELLETTTGAALIVDYGQEGSTDSIRAFSRHEQVHVLSRPGEVDVTADVDFEALRHAVNAKHEDTSSASNRPLAFGPVSQGKFLASMGAMDRVIQLIEDDNTTEEQAADLYYALERLVQPEHMGERYKVLAIARKKAGLYAPPGF